MNGRSGRRWWPASVVVGYADMQSTAWPGRSVLSTLDNSSPQVVLAGPPGTGKTWVAKAVASYLTNGRADAVRLVQFHPSYT